MMVWRIPGKAIVGAEIMMLGGVGVAREADRVRPSGEQSQKVGAVGGVGRCVARIEIIAQRNVHGGDDQRFRWIVLQHIGDERQLPFADAAFERAAAARFCRIEAEIIDVVEHQEHGAAVFEGVGGRARRCA